MSYKWQHSTPEAEGLDSTVLNQLDDYIKQKRYRLVNSVLVVKNGKIVFERYYNRFHEHSRNPIKSIWKSILAITTGICLDKGIIASVDEPIGTYVREFAQHAHPYHKLITIRHLLTMTSGIYWNGGVHYRCPMIQQMMRTSDWTSHIADIEMTNVPGFHFQYKEWDAMLLSAVLGRACGGTAYDIAKTYLYEPLDISSGKWPQSPCGFSYTVMKGEEQSDLSARDLAKIGLLFLENGMYNGSQIVSSEFVKLAVQPSNHLTYGFLCLLFSDGYGCRGFGGQEVNVVPEHQFVSVIQASPTPSSKSYGDINNNILKKAIL
jgi:CubicO group peptidase (beta-lactamase class C family)